MKNRILAFIMLLFTVGKIAALGISISGEVHNSGIVNVAEGSRINDALQQVIVSEQAFFLGASWYRETEKSKQQQLKQGLIFDLGVLANIALLNNQQELATIAQKLKQQIIGMPVTGRMPHILDPAALLVTDINHLLQEGDHLFYPATPANVQVMGMTKNDCNITFSGMNNIDHYIKQCPKTRHADKNTVYIIQADGAIFKQGVALWNLDKKTLIAPGAIILIPVDQNILDYHDIPRLNDDIASFLATQVPLANIAP